MFLNQKMKKMTKIKAMSISMLALLLVLSISCNEDEPTTIEEADTEVSIPLAFYTKIYGATSVTTEGDFVVIKTTGQPDHKSIYYATTNTLYEDFSGTTFSGVTFRKNPNNIVAKSYTYKIPMNPKIDANHSATPLGPIGVSINGVPFFNQYAGPNQPLTNEVMSFDQYYGHPTGQGEYHYHVEPIYLTTVKASKSALIGFLLDGFPVYGPEENGKSVVEAELDDFHGHSTATEDFPNGIYHYHVTDKDPYINGSGFYGTAGTVTR
jgi:hypothetical protein